MCTQMNFFNSLIDSVGGGGEGEGVQQTVDTRIYVFNLYMIIISSTLVTVYISASELL